MTEETRNVIMRNGKMYVGGDVTKEYVDTAIANAVADIDDDISALSDTVAGKVDKVNGKSLSTNDYTDADKALVQDSPITVTATASPISTANGKPRKLTIYGKSEVVDGAIKSAGEGYAVVDLRTLNWTYSTSGSPTPHFDAQLPKPTGVTSYTTVLPMMCTQYDTSHSWASVMGSANAYGYLMATPNNYITITDSNYTDAATFKSAVSGVILCYQLADPTQGNTIAIKTDNGTGIDGTMATFTTGTPLYGVSETVRDAMVWNGSAGTVTKNCASVDLGTLNYTYATEAISRPTFGVDISDLAPTESPLLCALYSSKINRQYIDGDMQIARWNNTGSKTILITNSNYTDAASFKSAMSGVMLIYELATPTTTPLTQTENESLSALKTYAPQTVVTINDNPEFEIEAYANTANGQAISDMQPTRSPLLTLTASGWTNNAQTITYEHDTGKRNTIDVEPTSIKAWTAAGILATAETASTITFECDTVPTTDLSFRVTSMEVR